MLQCRRYSSQRIAYGAHNRPIFRRPAGRMFITACRCFSSSDILIAAGRKRASAVEALTPKCRGNCDGGSRHIFLAPTSSLSPSCPFGLALVILIVELGKAVLYIGF
jgi:hypothetical protein